jgi:hypothetical protein
MFIKLFAALNVNVNNNNKPSFIWFDANEIDNVMDVDPVEVEEVGCTFIHRGVDYRCETFTAEALVELVIEARLHPAQCLPNVGKPKDESRIGERLRINPE